MKKRVIVILLVLAFVLSMTAYAVEPRTTKATPDLTFSGTTANCKVVISEPNAEIEATLTLYRGLSRIAYWTESGTGYVFVSGTAEVKEGLEYRLEVTGTIDGEAFTGTPVYGTCGE